MDTDVSLHRRYSKGRPVVTHTMDTDISLHRRYSKGQPVVTHTMDTYISLHRRYSKGRPVVTHTMDEEELQHFRSLANTWWDETGEFEALHTMNKLRVPFIRDGIVHQMEALPENPSQPLKGLSVVDVGSGGGLLAEVTSLYLYTFIWVLHSKYFFLIN